MINGRTLSSRMDAVACQELLINMSFLLQIVWPPYSRTLEDWAATLLSACQRLHKASLHTTNTSSTMGFAGLLYYFLLLCNQLTQNLSAWSINKHYLSFCRPEIKEHLYWVVLALAFSGGCHETFSQGYSHLKL